MYLSPPPNNSSSRSPGGQIQSQIPIHLIQEQQQNSKEKSTNLPTFTTQVFDDEYANNSKGNGYYTSRFGGQVSSADWAGKGQSINQDSESQYCNSYGYPYFQDRYGNWGSNAKHDEEENRGFQLFSKQQQHYPNYFTPVMSNKCTPNEVGDSFIQQYGVDSYIENSEGQWRKSQTHQTKGIQNHQQLYSEFVHQQIKQTPQSEEKGQRKLSDRSRSRSNKKYSHARETCEIPGSISPQVNRMDFQSEEKQINRCFEAKWVFTHHTKEQEIPSASTIIPTNTSINTKTIPNIAPQIDEGNIPSFTNPTNLHDNNELKYIFNTPLKNPSINATRIQPTKNQPTFVPDKYYPYPTQYGHQIPFSIIPHKQTQGQQDNNRQYYDQQDNQHNPYNYYCFNNLQPFPLPYYQQYNCQESQSAGSIVNEPNNTSYSKSSNSISNSSNSSSSGNRSSKSDISRSDRPLPAEVQCFSTFSGLTQQNSKESQALAKVVENKSNSQYESQIQQKYEQTSINDQLKSCQQSSHNQTHKKENAQQPVLKTLSVQQDVNCDTMNKPKLRAARYRVTPVSLINVQDENVNPKEQGQTGKLRRGISKKEKTTFSFGEDRYFGKQLKQENEVPSFNPKNITISKKRPSRVRKSKKESILTSIVSEENDDILIVSDRKDSDEMLSLSLKNKFDTKNLVKNFLNQFLSFVMTEETIVRSLLSFTSNEVTEYQEKLKLFFKNKKFNRALLKEFIHIVNYRKVFQYFLQNRAQDWIEFGRMKDKPSHFRALSNFIYICENHGEIKSWRFRYNFV